MNSYLRSIVPARVRRWRRIALARFGHWRADLRTKALISAHAPSEATIIQIGANDGGSGDLLRPLVLRHKRWKAVFVEPSQTAFDRLVRNYGSSRRFRFVKAAIAAKTGPVELWSIDPAVAESLEISWSSDHIGSLDPDHLRKFLPPHLQAAIRSEVVDGKTLGALLEETHTEHVDVMMIDTEGHDYTILDQLLQSPLRPGIIVYEHLHLLEADAAAAISRLSEAQYQITKMPADVVAIRIPSPRSDRN